MAGEGSSRAIGIDLGTTYSCAGVWRGIRGVEIIPSSVGARVTPSYVAFDDDERFVGESAKNQASMNPTNTIFNAKRLIGRRFSDYSVQEDMKSWPFKLFSGKDDKPMIQVEYDGEDEQLSAEQVSAMILAEIKERAEEFLGHPVTEAVVTVPAYFNTSQRQATRDAGTIANLNILQILTEPTAAAIAYGFDNKSGGASGATNILIFDLGGGTFDVCILCVHGVDFQVKAINGDTHLGGEDFDHRMVQHFVKEINKKNKMDISGNAKALRKLRTACEKAKRLLATAPKANVEVDSLYDGIDICYQITRARFEDLNMDLFKKCMGPVEKCLADAGMEKGMIDDVVLVGGSTRILKVQELLKEFFNGKEPSKKINADEAVAYGAAIQAANLSQKKNNAYQTHTATNVTVPAVTLHNVTPHFLGIEVLGGTMSVLIERNTTIPTRKKKAYRTIQENQDHVLIKVYEGVSINASENKLLGKFTLSGIPPAPAGLPKVHVTFDIDADGIVNVSAEFSIMGMFRVERSRMDVAIDMGRFTEEEIGRMKEEARISNAREVKRKEVVAAKNSLLDYAFGVKGKLGHLGSRHEIEGLVAEAIEWAESSNSREASEFGKKLQELEIVCKPLLPDV